MRLSAAMLIATIAFALGSCALAQSEWPVDVLIPDAISVRMETQDIAFGLTTDDYPPPAFPARYPATVPEGGRLLVEVFSNAEGAWSLVLEIPELIGEDGVMTIRPDQVLFRVDEGIWVRGSAVPQVIFSSLGPTPGWLPIAIDFQVELDGFERPGDYRVNAILTAAVGGG